MNKKIKSALISVFNKDELQNIIQILISLGIKIYSTGGTQKFIEELGVSCTPVESLTTYPSILGGRVKTLHPSVFGGILGRRDNEKDVEEMSQYNIPEIDLVIVDLYPFEETVRSTNDEAAIIEKIDIGGPSMIRAAAKNFKDVFVVAAKKDYSEFEKILTEKKGETSLEDRKLFAAKAFEVVAYYDVAIAKYFNPETASYFLESVNNRKVLRYGENPHQQGIFYGDTAELFGQLHGKELSYNNLVDVDAAMQLMSDVDMTPSFDVFTTFAIIKHTNVCGMAHRETTLEAWEAALAGDPESAFGGVLICGGDIDKSTALAINEIFFEVLIAWSYDEDALEILRQKKNRILLQQKINTVTHGLKTAERWQYRSILNGVLAQQPDSTNDTAWKTVGGREATLEENIDMAFANVICKHLKSNAIALVKNKQLIGKGCGQTSRIDALRQAIEKAGQFNFDLNGAVLASDAFFPFDDCVRIAHAAGITAFIQPGGSIRDKDSIEYCKQNDLAMVLTGMRHFKH